MQSPFSPKRSCPPEVRQNPRLPLKPLHKVSFQFEKNGTFYKLFNISIGGFGFFSRKESSVNSEKNNHSVQLYIDTLKFEVQIEVVHRSDKVTGCRFVNSDPKLVEAIENYFIIELSALKMSRVESKDDGSPEGKILFFLGQNNCEILIHENYGAVQHFSIILFGNYLEGDQKGTLWVGEKIDYPTAIAPDGVHLFKPVQKADIHLIESASRLIDSVQGLTEVQKKTIIDLLMKSDAKVINEPIAKNAKP